jgi:DNA repair exonuclease SbcCD nuclease subunit
MARQSGPGGVHGRYPSDWRLGGGRGVSVRFLHSADWQLGMTRHFLAAEAQARFSQARIDAIRTLGRLASETGAAFLVVSGDVFETNQVSAQTVRRALDALASVPVPVFLLPGNHDPLDAGSIFRAPTFASGRPAHVTVLEDAVPRPVPGLAGVEVVGAPWLTKRPLSDLVADACSGLLPSKAATRVLVAHGAAEISFENPAAIRVPEAEAALADGRIAYLALGDRHSTTSIGSTGRIWYAGAPEPTDYDELDAGNALLVELTDDGRCEVTKLRTGTWRFARERFDLDGTDGIEALAAWLDTLAPKDRTIVKLTLVGTVSLSANARLEALLEHEGDLFAAIEQWERHTDLVVRPDDDDFADLRLTGFAAEAVAVLRAGAAGTGPQADAARDALALLVRFASAAGAIA